MRMLTWIVAILALASSVDSYHYNGYFGQSIVRMITEMAYGLKLIGQARLTRLRPVALINAGFRIQEMTRTLGR